MDELTQNKPFDLPPDIQYIETIDHGAFGTVIKAKDLGNFQILAIKIISKRNASNSLIRRMREEISILKQLRHKNIVSFYGYEETNSNFLIKMEYIKFGTLTSYLRRRSNIITNGNQTKKSTSKSKNNFKLSNNTNSSNNNSNENLNQSNKSINNKFKKEKEKDNSNKNILLPPKISEEEASKIIQNLISAIAYLHSKRICHRDLKPDNVMFSREDDLDSLKIIDFGLSAQNFNYLTDTEYCGTFLYMAPEQIEKKLYNFSIDIWSLGIMMFMLLNNGKHPFYNKGDKKKDFINKLKTAKFNYSNKVSYLADNLLKHILEPNPSLRYTADKVIYHPWITRKNNDSIPFTFNEIINKNNRKKNLELLFGVSVFLNDYKKNILHNKLDKLNKILERKEIFLLSKNKKSWVKKYTCYKIGEDYINKCEEISQEQRKRLENMRKNGLEIETTEEGNSKSNAKIKEKEKESNNDLSLRTVKDNNEDNEEKDISIKKNENKVTKIKEKIKQGDKDRTYESPTKKNKDSKNNYKNYTDKSKSISTKPNGGLTSPIKRDKSSNKNDSLSLIDNDINKNSTQDNNFNDSSLLIVNSDNIKINTFEDDQIEGANENSNINNNLAIDSKYKDDKKVKRLSRNKNNIPEMFAIKKETNNNRNDSNNKSIKNVNDSLEKNLKTNRDHGKILENVSPQRNNKKIIQTNNAMYTTSSKHVGVKGFNSPIKQNNNLPVKIYLKDKSSDKRYIIDSKKTTKVLTKLNNNKNINNLNNYLSNECNYENNNQITEFKVSKFSSSKKNNLSLLNNNVLRSVYYSNNKLTEILPTNLFKNFDGNLKENNFQSVSTSTTSQRRCKTLQHVGGALSLKHEFLPCVHHPLKISKNQYHFQENKHVNLNIIPLVLPSITNKNLQKFVSNNILKAIKK